MTLQLDGGKKLKEEAQKFQMLQYLLSQRRCLEVLFSMNILKHIISWGWYLPLGEEDILLDRLKLCYLNPDFLAA